MLQFSQLHCFYIVFLTLEDTVVVKQLFAFYGYNGENGSRCLSKQVTFASPNEDELIAMANALSAGNSFSYSPSQKDKCSIESLFQMLKPAIRVLLENGIKIVIVTLGSNGVFLCSKGGPRSLRTIDEGIKRNYLNRQLYKTVTAACPSYWGPNSTEFESNSLLFAVHFPTLPATVVRLTGAGDCLVGATLSSICAGLDIMQGVAVGIAASKATVEAETNVPRVFDFATVAGMSLK